VHGSPPRAEKVIGLVSRRDARTRGSLARKIWNGNGYGYGYGYGYEEGEEPY
jgi:hypothetical protein